MPQNFNPTTSLTPQQLANQLTKPEGKTGKTIGYQMNEGNKQITYNSYEILAPIPGDHILEIGMGNGFYVKELLNTANNLKYTGIDFSEIMVHEANTINADLIEQQKAFFHCASIEKLPLNNESVDCIVSTNTIYFWPHPYDNTKEIYRVLKPGGRVCIAYRSPDFLNKLELTKFGFRKYKANAVKSLLTKAGFTNITTQRIKEPEVNFNGSLVQMEGLFTCGIKNNLYVFA